MSDKPLSILPGQRGVEDHVIREQLLVAANDHFGHYGYGKTTVSDLAGAIGFSKAYIYKFFESKQAIGEAICRQCTGTILRATVAALDTNATATQQFRTLFLTLVEQSSELFFLHRKLYEIVTVSTVERWRSSREHEDLVHDLVREILLSGRKSGEFERKTPLDEVCRSIVQALQPFTNPMMLQYNLDALPLALHETLSLVLRSLSP